MKKTLFFTAVILHTIWIQQACTRNSTAELDKNNHQNEVPVQKAQGYFIDENGDGQYVFVETEKKIVLFEDEMGFSGGIYKNIRYPADAREKGIGGQVVLEASINELGYVTNVEIIKRVYPSIDAEAKKAFLEGTANGYGQLKLNSKFVKFKVDVPIKFVVQGKR